MDEKPADRTWELKWGADWVRVVAMDASVIVLASGEGVWWRRTYPPSQRIGATECLPSALPDERLRLRYSVPVRDPEGNLVPMEPRPGYVDGLAQDMGHPELMTAIREALAGERQATIRRP